MTYHLSEVLRGIDWAFRNRPVLNARMVISFLGAAFVCFAALTANAVAGPEEDGTWSEVISWPHIPVSAANLPDGRILTWSSNEVNEFFPNDEDFTYTAVWDPTTGQFQEISRNGHDMFCGHIVMLEDGRIIVNGGNDESFGRPQVSIFDFRNDTWDFTFSLNSPRWYPTSVAMPDGTVFTALGAGGGQYPEVWTEDTGWETKSGINFNNTVLNYTDRYETSWWPLLHLAPDGRIFHSGPTPQMHMINPNGAGVLSTTGGLVDSWYHKHGATVMYREGMILTAGGALAGDNLGSTNRAMVIDITGTAPVVREIASMANPRKFHNGVLLPNGEVLVVGGNINGEKFNDNDSIFDVEIWNPDTETWRTVAATSVPRNYHSVGLLMTDGRVLSGGGGLCNCEPDHPDAQIYTPFYLYNADGSLRTRPTIGSAPSLVGVSQVFRVEGSDTIERFTLIKMSATTHAVNSDLRFLEVPFTEVSPGVFDLTAHDNINVLTPGYWMLFGLDAEGTPSVASVIQVSTQNLPQLDDPGPQSSIVDVADSLQLTASDPNNDPLTFAATGLPPGLSINENTGLISGTPTTQGNYTVTASVSDGTGSNSVTISWTVSEPSQNGQKTVVFNDFNDMSRIALNGGAESNGGLLEVTPNIQFLSGSAFFNEEVDWASDSSFSTVFNFTIAGGHGDGQGGDGMTFMIQGDGLTALGGLGSDLGYAGIGASVAVEFDNFGRADENDPSDNHIAIMANGDLSNHLDSYSPSFLIEDGTTRTVWVDYDGATQLLEVYVSETSTTLKPADPVLTQTIDIHSIVGDTAWFGFSAGTGYFYGSHGVNNWTLTIPGEGGDENVAPVVSNPGDQTTEINTAVNLQISATDANGDTLAYSAVGLPAGLSINTATGLISGTPTTEQTTSVTVSVTDNIAAPVDVTFDWTISDTPPTNTAPVITNPGTQTTIVGSAVSLQIVASDADGDTLTYGASALPTGLTIDEDTGLISGTANTTGSFAAQVTVSDGTASPSISFTWNVNPQSGGGGEVTKTFDDFTDMSEIVVNGDALGADGQLLATDNVQYAAGTAFYNQGIAWNADSSFSTRFQFNISGGDPDLGGDGMTFMAQSVGLDALGPLGSGLGYSGIGQSVAVEIDNFARSDENDPSENHLGVMTNGDVSTHLASYTPAALFEDGNTRTLWVDYDGASNQLEVYLAESATTVKPATPVLSVNVDLGTVLGDTVWFGFSAGTGFFYNSHAVLNWTLTVPGEGGSTNSPPVVTNPGAQSTEVGTEVSLQIEASDPDDDPLSYAASGLPPGLSIGATTGNILGNPTTPGDFTATVTVADDQTGSTNVVFAWEITEDSTGGNQAPNVSNPGAQVSTVGEAVSLQIVANDAELDPITYSATGLPAGLSINDDTGLITGTPTNAAVYNTTVSATDDSNATGSESFTWTVNEPAAVTIAKIVSPPKPVDIAISYTADASGEGDLTYTWVFGDGTPTVGPLTSPTVEHTFTAPGRYVATLTVTDSLDQSASRNFTQAVHEPLTAGRPGVSSSIHYHDVAGTDTVWTVNPDNDSVTVFNAATGAKLAEIGVGGQPVALTRVSDSRIWVANRRSASVSILDAGGFNVVDTVDLPNGSAPYGIVAAPDGARVYIALENLGQISVRQSSDASEIANIDVGDRPRHLSITHDGDTVYAARFVSPMSPGEETGTVSTTENGQQVGGEVTAIDTSALTAGAVIVLQHSDRPDSELSGRGVPNYLGSPSISPDGLSAFVPSKQDNIQRGQLRDGNDLTHDLTVRAVASRIDLSTQTEDYPARLDLNNSSTPVAAAFGAYGSYMFVALEGNRQVAVVDPYGSFELFRFDVDSAPQGVVVSPDGTVVYVHNFMSRTVTVHDVTNLINEDEFGAARIGTWSTVASEALAANVLTGKQLFYDAQDPRLALQTYMSCASCHNDGGHDGRVWDFTQFNEGLRNTISLQGHGQGMGPLHWSANFDEVHDFENQIRDFAGGTGLMSDTDFNNTADPLGPAKAGLSDDLDALSAYVQSLINRGTSPKRAADGSLTADGAAGREVFLEKGCASCHAGNVFTDSASGGFHDIGTIKSSTGPLTGIDTPTLAGLWVTGPYLHDGSAATLGDAIDAHDGVSLSTTERTQLIAYLEQIDQSETNPDVGDGTVFDFPDFTDVSAFQLNGAATATNNALNVIADGEDMASGSVFLSQSMPISGATSFSTRFQFRIYGGDADGRPLGDGMAFLVQGNAATALGTLGSGIGYGTVDNSVVIELDTWGGNDQNDPSDNHVAVMQNGVTDDHLASFTPAFNLKDGASHTVWVDYDGASDTLDVYIAEGATTAKPSTPAITTTIDLAATVGGDAWFGFSAGTGYFYAGHDVENWTLELTE